MTRKAIHCTLSALAALTLVFAFTGAPASAQHEAEAAHKQEMEYLKQEKWGAPQKPKTPKGLTTKKGPQASKVEGGGIDINRLGNGIFGLW